MGAQRKPLLGSTDIRCLAHELGIKPTKKLGQNFVIEPSAVRKIVADSAVAAGTRVLEVGPGLGSLTLALLEAGAYVSAIEIDSALARHLPSTIEQHQPQALGRFALLESDALAITSAHMLAVPPELAPGLSLSKRQQALHNAYRYENSYADSDSSRAWNMPYQPTHLVANLPYNVAVPVLLALLSAVPSLREVTVMVQAEVADRLAARAGSRIYGVPSVKLAWFGQARKGDRISRQVFWPVPNVDSALVHVQLYRSGSAAHPLYDGIYDCDTRERVFHIVDAAFSQRRKTQRFFGTLTARQLQERARLSTTPQWVALVLLTSL